MKKITAIFLVLMMVLSAATVFAADIKVVVNGEEAFFVASFKGKVNATWGIPLIKRSNVTARLY